MQEDTPRIKYTAEERRKLWGNEEVRKERQEWKAKKELFDKYVAKLNDDEKPPAPSKRKLPYYLRKDWLMERAATLLGLNKIMRKPASGFEDYHHPEPQLVIYPHEAAKLLKKTIRAAQYDLKKIREINNRVPRRPVLMKEFCEYFGLDIEDVKKALVS